MANQFSVNTVAAFGAIEGTAGTAATLTSADYKTKLMAPEFQSTIEYDDEAAKFASGDHAGDFSISGANKASFKASTRIAWSGDYSAAPDWFKYAQACGHSVVAYRRQLSGAAASGQKVVLLTGTVTGKFVIGQQVTLKEGANTELATIATVGASSLTMVANLTNSYTSAGFVYTGQALQPLMGSDATTMTCGRYAKKAGVSSADATLETVVGAMGNMEIVADGIGKSITATFDMGGKFGSYTDVAFASVPVFSGDCNEVADNLIGSTLTVAGSAQKISKFSLLCGNGIETLSDQSDSTGYLHSIIAKRDPKITFDPLRLTVAEDDVYADAKTEAGKEIILTTEHFQIRVPKGQFISPAVANREGLFSWEKNFRCLRNCTAAGAALDTVLPVEATYEIIMGARC